MWKQVIVSPVGPLEATWTDEGLRALSFLAPDNLSSERTSSVIVPTDIPRRIRILLRHLEEALEYYFQSGDLKWSLDDLDWSEVSEFHCKVLKLCHAIPTGETLTYGQLAKLAGAPMAARAVGGAMARNRWPLVVFHVTE